MKRHRIRRPTRKEMIAALGLEGEGRTRGQKYDATTAEFWKKIRHSDSRAADRAREMLVRMGYSV